MPDVEICENCGSQIGKLETACVYKGQVVCAECDRKLRNIPSNPESDPNQIKCPKCNSTQIMGGQKGFSGGRAFAWTVLAGPVGLFAGLIGSKKVVISCLSCGHKWEVGG